MDISPNDILARECRFVTHVRATDYREDTHVVNELLHLKSGEKVKTQRLVTNYKRPFWVTKPIFRKHEQKHESERLDRVQKYMSTQSDLSKSVAKILGTRDVGLRKLANSPYLYGTDILSTTLIKAAYMKKFPDVFTPYTVCTLDFETTTDTFEILMGTVSMDGKCYTVVLKSFVRNVYEPDIKLRKAIAKHIPDKEVLERTNFEFAFVDTEIDILRALFAKVNEWNPDWLAIWNIDFEVPTMQAAAERANVNLADIVVGDKLPRKYRTFNYVQGIKNRMTDSGKFVPIPPEDRWHVVYSTASFYFIDAMCTYAAVRRGESKVVGGYSLDNILDKELNQKKIKFEEANGYVKGAWHDFMQENHPIEYIVYNQWDSLSMVELDKKTRDLSTSVPTLAGPSDFAIFNSQPKRLMDEMFFYLLREKGKVVASSPKDHSPLYSELLGKDHWVITLPAHMIENNGIAALSDSPATRTNMRAHVYDNDAVSSYPSDTRAANVSNTTTMQELVSIEGFDKLDFMKQNINLVVGSVNSIEYCQTMFGFPSLRELSDLVE